MDYKGLEIEQPGKKVDKVYIYDCEIDINGMLWLDFIQEECNDCGSIVATMKFENVTKDDVRNIVKRLIKNDIPVVLD